MLQIKTAFAALGDSRIAGEAKYVRLVFVIGLSANRYSVTPKLCVYV